MPMPRRRLTSAALRTDGGVVYLLDCGEGTQVPYKELHLGLRALRVVSVTHLHADHCLGLPGLLMLRAQMPDPEPLTVLGPPGLRRFIQHVRRDLGMYINYEIDIRQWSEGAASLAYEDDQLQISWYRLNHSVLCLGYRLEEHGRPGRFDPEAATALGVACGPLWGQLQQGQTVHNAAGQSVTPDQVLGPPRRGRRVGFVTDTAPCPNIQRVMDGADLVFVEGMFHSEQIDDARSKKHLTVAQACGAASRAGARRVVLVHLSPRYTQQDIPRLSAEAAQHHDQARVARDGETFKLDSPQ